MATGPLLVNEDFESGTTDGWTGYACTVANSTAQANTGTHSLALTNTSGGTSMLCNPPAVIQIRAGATYTLTAAFYAASTVRQVGFLMRWQDSASNIVRDDYVGNVTEPSAAWITTSATVTAPAGAYTINPVPYIYTPALSEVHYVDTVKFNQTGANPTYIQWKTHSGTGPGLYPSTVRGRWGQALAALVSGQNPDGTTRGT